MKFFVCLLDSNGHDIPDQARRTYEALPRSRGLAFQWHLIGRVAVLTGGSESYEESVAASDGDVVAVGTVRLDNRTELERRSGRRGCGLTDLELLSCTVARYGTKCISRVLGDFAFVVWNATTRTAVAACDPFAVRKLYYAERKGLFAFASRAEALALEERYEVQYLAERVATCAPTPGLSVYAGVRSISGGTMAVVEHGGVTTREYWTASAFEVEPAWAKSQCEVAETCRDLLAESVRLRLGSDGHTWSQLSGGVDSSSVVSVAQWLAARGAVPHGLAGTVTFADSHGTGADEREYSDAVASHWRLRNDTIVDAPTWHDNQYAPPRTDEPIAALVVHPRDHRLCEIVRREGGRVLLTGVGGDDLFTGNMFFFADWMVHGRAWPAVHEMARRAALGRVSFWELAYRNAVLPLLPRRLQHHLVRDDGQMSPWVAPALARQYDLHARALAPASYTGRIGSKYHDAVVKCVEAIRSGLSTGVIEDALDVRHPFLYRPLVEFALRLPPELCARPNARKWVVREAMRGILPEIVRTRVGKGVLTGLFAWITATQEKLLRPLLHDPILADLGVIDAARLRAELAAARHERANRERLSAAVQYTLAIEAWLQMRSGRWLRGAASPT